MYFFIPRIDYIYKNDDNKISIIRIRINSYNRISLIRRFNRNVSSYLEVE